MNRRARSTLAGTAAVVGLLAGEMGGALMHFPPYLPQQLLRNPMGAAAVVSLAVGTVASLVLWAHSSSVSGRLAFVVATTGAGLLAVIVNVLAPALGLWSGRVFEGPLLPLALLTGVRALFQFALILGGYRWMAARRPRLALLLYLVILIALIPGTIRGDQPLLDSGALAFRKGYRIWHDVLLGELFFVLPLILYETCLRRLRGRGSEPGGLRDGLVPLWEASEAVRRELLVVLEGLSPSEWGNRPGDNVWSVAQQVDHLVRAESGTSKMARRLIRGDFLGTIRPGGARLFDSRLAAYPYDRLPAPAGLEPADLPFHETIERLTAAQQRFLAELRRFQGPDPDALASPHPATGDWFTLAGWLRLQALHEAHHIRQIKERLASARGGRLG